MKIRLPHPLVLLLGGVAVAALLTWLLPAGEYQRVHNAAAGRDVVVPGTYARVEPSPVGPLAAVLAVPKGIVAGADVILTILFVGGAFALLEATGALARLVGSVVRRSRNPRTTIAAMCIVCAAFGAMDNMHEEFIALMPVFVLLSLQLGYGAITALAMSVGAAAVGAAFGPTNPFGAGIALRFAELPSSSSIGVRFMLLVIAVALWIAWTLWYAPRDDVRPDVGTAPDQPASARDVLMLAVCVVPILVYVYGVLQFDWGFNELSALFLVAGFAIGLIARMGLTGTTVGFIRGMESMLGASLFVGVARAISVVFTEGRVMDTIVAGLVAPLEQIPATAAAIVMIPVHAAIHVVVTSNSGQAVLTMPIMGPTADLLGFTRDAAVMAYQAGAPSMDIVIPTNGALLAMLLKAGVPYGRWIRFAIPGVLLMMLVGVVGIVVLK
jgi:uncharacterized ion transporter superfamily protein YfcC